MTAKLAVSRLDKRFDELEALREIDVSVAPGEFISLVGPSGCGKTTFLRIVAGLEAASAGAVLIDGNAGDEARSATAASCSRTTICCRGAPCSATR